ncbi:SDR family oxidoreductase [Halorhodospira halochloris]|uniref:SDR family NAD(P)-dependent oxidoreductase n=1 Tax=Halorhodospira halochloris TaxID=1052 RepID=UPI001EE8DA64|nr:SDR family NAD(P)-dependent oxidoreductase [Halorhodospira halochloris]MCG5530040.1 SDR family oxidoreductase [Halorhodospira halochloris]
MRKQPMPLESQQDSGESPDRSRRSEHGQAPDDPERRRFLTGATAGLVGMAAAGTAFGGWPEGMREGEGRYAGAVVLITGATSGIGEAAARAYAREGAKVFFCGRREELGESVAASIRETGGEATFMSADVRERDDMRNFVDGCLEAYGRLDIAFNNAGIEGPLGEFDAIDVSGENGYRDVMRTNVDGVYYAMRYEIPVMREQGHGVIVNTGSMLSHTGSSHAGAYAATKHAVIGLTRSAAAAEVGHGLRVVSLSPGGTRTELLRRFRGGSLEGADEAHPMGRIAEPEDIAGVLLQITAPEATYLNGDDVKADGASAASG